jgi:hypothetical protein
LDPQELLWLVLDWVVGDELKLCPQVLSLPDVVGVDVDDFGST